MNRFRSSRTDGMSIGGLAARTGVNRETIRYYEHAGLMPAPPRSAGGHRVYDEGHAERLGFIRRGRELGFSLAEIRTLLDLVDGGEVTCAEVRERTLRRLAEVRRKQADLHRLERTLQAMAERCAGGAEPDCPVIDALWPGR